MKKKKYDLQYFNANTFQQCAHIIQLVPPRSYDLQLFYYNTEISFLSIIAIRSCTNTSRVLDTPLLRCVIKLNLKSNLCVIGVSIVFIVL